MHDFSPILLSNGMLRNREDPVGWGNVLLGLAVIAVLIAGAAILSRIHDRRQRRQGYDNPKKLFFQLCKVHHLNPAQRRLLWRMARSLNLAEPSTLFLEPQRFDHSLLGPIFFARWEEVQAIRDRVFGEQVPVPPAERRRRSMKLAAELTPPPLFPNLTQPTLDIPPWTAGNEK